MHELQALHADKDDTWISWHDMIMIRYDDDYEQDYDYDYNYDYDYEYDYDCNIIHE